MKLHIGCKGESIPGFKRLDIVQHGDVDFVQDAADLSNLQDESVDEIYASHILEHWPKAKTPKVLKEWCRVLKPKGILWCAVPDFNAIVDIYMKSGRTLTTWLGYVLHGDQFTPQDFHYNAFNFQTLSAALSEAGFSRIDKVEQFPYGLTDASTFADSWGHTPISLNVKAVK